ncbi:MAG: N-formylglutamate amidohydrolase [Alphaproteobacteria bacterium]|nr:N-formylglutamate amidohydrolase [Alphaproteobacteria bacterium]
MSPVLTRRLDTPSSNRRFLIICDHASNFVPPELNALGLPQGELERHIAYDIGALEVAEKIAETLECPLVASQFSRLLIDPNRGLDDPTLVMKLSDGSIIPANENIDPFQDKAAWQARIDAFYRPYNQAIEAAIDDALSIGQVPIILSVHSFTPVWRGQTRPWQAAVLWDQDARLRDVMVDYMATQTDMCFGDNEPYSGQLKNDCLYRHGTQKGLPHALIELRQDLIGDEAGQTIWAGHMVEVMRRVEKVDLTDEIMHFGSIND